jgi:hypothetical protein
MGWRSLIAVLILGTGLRVWQYAANPSLWLDEIALASSILNRNLTDLVMLPLAHDQVAPKGFLIIEKAAVAALGPSDYVLRLLPLAASLASLFLFGRLAAKILEGIAPIVAVALFATAAPLIAFAGLVKQYSTDVCVAVVLLWLAYDLASRPMTTTRVWGAAVAGGILAWFSHPAVLMLTALGASLVSLPLVVAPAAGASGGLRRVMPIAACWGMSGLAATLAATAGMTVETRDYMHRFWTIGFPPLSLQGLVDTLWPLDQLLVLLGSGLPASHGYPLPALYLTLAAIGFSVLWRRNRKAAILLGSPFVVALGAAVARQYPFSDRLILFLVPGLLLAIAAAVEWLRQRLSALSRPLSLLVAAGVVVPAVYPVAALPPAYRTEDMKPVLSYVEARRGETDAIYVYYGAVPAVIFYAPQYGLTPEEYSAGGCHRGDNRRYLRELDTFRGRSRVWVLFTHTTYDVEREDILSYLDTIGTRQNTFVARPRAVGWRPLPAEAFLYDLGDSPRLRTATADSFPLADPFLGDGPLGCGQGPLAMASIRTSSTLSSGSR